MKVEHEAKLSYGNDTIKVLEQSNAQKALSITELETKLTTAFQEIEDKTLKVKEANQLVNQMKMDQESNKALLNGLTSEKRHLELSLKENVEIKEQYKNKCEEL